jgi:hypothetical protein
LELKYFTHLEQRSSMGPCVEKNHRQGHLLDIKKLF